MKIETNSDPIILRQELINIIEIANLLPSAYDKESSFMFDPWKLSDEELDKLFGTLDESGEIDEEGLLAKISIIAEILPVALEVADSLPEVQQLLAPAGVDLRVLYDSDYSDKARLIDWKEELPLIFAVLGEAMDLGNPLTEEDMIAFALNIDSEELRDFLVGLGSRKFFQELMPIVINVALNMDAVKQLIHQMSIGLKKCLT